MLSFLESKREREERLNLVDPHLNSNHQPCETACDLVQPFIHLYKDLRNNYGLQNITESFTPKNGITQHWWRGSLSPPHHSWGTMKQILEHKHAWTQTFGDHPRSWGLCIYTGPGSSHLSAYSYRTTFHILLKGNGASATRWLPYTANEISTCRLVIREDVTARQLLELSLTKILLWWG